MPDIDAAAAFTGLYNREARVDAGNHRSVREEATGGYLQGNFKGEIGGLGFAANAGVRYMETDQTSIGLVSARPTSNDSTTERAPPSRLSSRAMSRNCVCLLEMSSRASGIGAASTTPWSSLR